MKLQDMKQFDVLTETLVHASLKAAGIIEENKATGAAKGDAQMLFVRAVAPLVEDEEKDFPILWKDVETKATKAGMKESSRDTLRKELKRWIAAARYSPVIFGAVESGISAQNIGTYVVTPLNALAKGKPKGEPIVTKAGIEAAVKAKAAENEKAKAQAELAAKENDTPFNLLNRAISKLQAQGYADLLPALCREIETLRTAMIARSDEAKRQADIKAQTVAVPAAPVTGPAPTVQAAPAPEVDPELAKLTAMFMSAGLDKTAAATQAVAYKLSGK